MIGSFFISAAGICGMKLDGTRLTLLTGQNANGSVDWIRQYPAHGIVPLPAGLAV